MTTGSGPADLRSAVARLAALPGELGELVRVAQEVPARYGVGAH